MNRAVALRRDAFITDESGQDLVEYAMLMAFVALACLLGLMNLGTAINNTYSSASNSLVGAVS